VAYGPDAVMTGTTSERKKKENWVLVEKDNELEFYKLFNCNSYCLYRGRTLQPLKAENSAKCTSDAISAISVSQLLQDNSGCFEMVSMLP
jgi:hypothetical protein